MNGDNFKIGDKIIVVKHSYDNEDYVGLAGTIINIVGCFEGDNGEDWWEMNIIPDFIPPSKTNLIEEIVEYGDIYLDYAEVEYYDFEDNKPPENANSLCRRR